MSIPPQALELPRPGTAWTHQPRLAGQWTLRSDESVTVRDVLRILMGMGGGDPGQRYEEPFELQEWNTFTSSGEVATKAFTLDIDYWCPFEHAASPDETNSSFLDFRHPSSVRQRQGWVRGYGIGVACELLQVATVAKGSKVTHVTAPRIVLSPDEAPSELEPLKGSHSVARHLCLLQQVASLEDGEVYFDDELGQTRPSTLVLQLLTMWTYGVGQKIPKIRSCSSVAPMTVFLFLPVLSTKPSFFFPLLADLSRSQHARFHRITSQMLNCLFNLPSVQETGSLRHKYRCRSLEVCWNHIDQVYEVLVSWPHVNNLCAGLLERRQPQARLVFRATLKQRYVVDAACYGLGMRELPTISPLPPEDPRGGLFSVPESRTVGQWWVEEIGDPKRLGLSKRTADMTQAVLRDWSEVDRSQDPPARTLYWDVLKAGGPDQNQLDFRMSLVAEWMEDGEMSAPRGFNPAQHNSGHRRDRLYLRLASTTKSRRGYCL